MRLQDQNKRIRHAYRSHMSHAVVIHLLRYHFSTYGAIIALAPAEGMLIESFCEPGRMPGVLAGTASSHSSSWVESVLLFAEYQEPAWLASRIDILRSGR